jgi:hypothetical protein
MVRTIAGFAGFAIVVMIAVRLLGGLFGLLGSFLWLAFLGFVFYTLLRVFFPKGADAIRDLIQGKERSAD